MNITTKQVKEFIEKFLKAEADTYTKKAKKSLEDYNQASDLMYSYMTVNLIGVVGLQKLPPIFKMTTEERSPALSRFLFKTSKYQEKEHGLFWIAYVSSPDPSIDSKDLSYALSIAVVDDALKINGVYIYSKRRSGGKNFQWSPMGDTDLNGIEINSLSKPVEIQRYLEPMKDFEGSMENYLADI